MINKNMMRTGLIAMLLLIAAGVCGQEVFQVEGWILNSSSEGIQNVSVTFEGSNEAPSITDSTGYFSFNAPSGDIWLNISTLGEYKSKRVFLNRRSQMTLYLARRGTGSVFDEAIYLGSPQRQRDLSSSVFSVSPGQISEGTYESVDQMMTGRIAGVHQVGTSGMPGSGNYMLIRGLNSIHSNTQPLVIVDGMPLETPGILGSVVEGYVYNPLSSFDIRDISNISVIRDGSALSTFGVKGSNGIILIETLKPVETTTSIDFQYKTGMYFSERQLPLLGSDNYKTLAKEVITSSPFHEESYFEDYPGLYYIPMDDEYIRYKHNTNWQDEVFRNTWLNDAYLTVKGGDAIARYGLSVGFLNHNGIIQNTRYNRLNTRFVGTFNIFNWLRMYVSANLVSANSLYKESALVEETSPILTALHKSPQLYPFSYDQDGELLTKIDDVDELGVSNPRAVIDNYSARNTNYRFLTSFRVEGDISKSLKWNSLLGLNIVDTKEKVFMPNLGMEYYFNDEAYNVSQSLNNLLFSIYNDNSLSYTSLINDVHAIRVIGGARWQTYRYQADYAIAMNSSENDQYTNLQAGDDKLRDISGDNGRWNWLSNYLTAAYSFRDRYLLDAGVSMDFSTRVGNQAEQVIMINDRPFGLFYNLGGAWRLSGESFMSSMNFIEDLKFRLNYGTSGNDDVGNYNAYSYYILELYRETAGMIPGGFANTALTYESMSQLSTGLDLSIIGSRVMLSGNYYMSTTNDMLIYEQLNSYMGYERFSSNNASLEKTGYDISLFTRLLQTGDFALDLNLSISHYESTITSMPGDKIITRLPGGAEVINRTGDPANSFYGYEYNGVYSTYLEAFEANVVNEKGILYGPGDAKFSDLSGPDGLPDGVINEFDKVILGSATPEYFGSLSLDIKYKRFGIGLFWQFVSGNEVYNYLRYQNEKMTDLSNQSSAVLSRWVSDGQETNVPRALWNDPVGNTAFSSRWIEDGSYIRLKQVSLTYEIPEEIWFFRNLKVFVTGTNLLSFFNYLSYDPEFAYSFDPMMQGIDYGMMPMGKKIMAGFRFGL